METWGVQQKICMLLDARWFTLVRLNQGWVVKERCEIWYATSSDSVQPLQEYAKQQKATAKVVYFTDLIAIFVEAAQTFSDEISEDETRQKVVVDRIRRWISFQPTSSITET